MNEFYDLDRLIEESENVRRNLKWRRQDRIFKLTMLFMMLSFPIFFISLLVLGPTASSVILLVWLTLTLTPAIFFAFHEIASDLLKDEWEGRDMTKRYYRK